LLGRFQGGQLPPSRELPLIGLDWKEAERREAEAEAEDKEREKEKEEEEAEEEWGQEVDPKRTPRWPPPWRTTIKLAETYDEEILNIFNLK